MQKQQNPPNMIGSRVQQILNKINTARQLYKVIHPVTLVAVSKTKTVEEIMDAYSVGIRDFGESYAEEIEEKQPKLPKDIRWHFIGHLQSNKIRKILVPNLQYVESIDRESLAEKMNKQLEKEGRKLNIMIQVKTSDEDSKSGVDPQQLFKLYEFIQEKCSKLTFKGLMTIGKQGDENTFQLMLLLKKKMEEKYQLLENNVDLSMGMSADFQAAIKFGSTSVRVGSSIFGPRSYKTKMENL